MQIDCRLFVHGGLPDGPSYSDEDTHMLTVRLSKMLRDVGLNAYVGQQNKKVCANVKCEIDDLPACTAKISKACFVLSKEADKYALVSGYGRWMSDDEALIGDITINKGSVMFSKGHTCCRSTPTNVLITELGLRGYKVVRK